MTSTKTAAPDDGLAHDRATSRRKAVLFCPVCGSETPVANAHHANAADRFRCVRCPDCGTRIA